MWGLILSLIPIPSIIPKIGIWVGIAVAVIVGYAVWAAHEKNLGAQQAKAEADAVAVQHEQSVIQQSTTIDLQILKDGFVKKELSKKWSTGQ